MKKSFIILAFILSSCGLTNTKIGNMALISNVKHTDDVVQITNTNFALGTKEGRACGKNILGIFAEGDISVEAAKQNGHISTITSVSREVKNTIFVSEVCTIVKGN